MKSHKYRIGEIVMVKDLEWYYENCDYKGDVSVGCSFVKPMKRFCGRKAEIVLYTKDGYLIKIGDDKNNGWEWCDEMLERPSDVRKRKLLKLCGK